MKNLDDSMTLEEHTAWGKEARWEVYEVLRDHIRAVAQEMRDYAVSIRDEGWHPGESIEAVLLRFADRLEGKES